MAKLLQGKVAAITGAVTGIGRAIALEYLKNGASVAVNYFPDDKSATQFEELKQEAGEGEARLIAAAGDISKPETGQALVRKAVMTFGRLDIFVSNAGVCQFADFLTMSPDLVNHTISTNLNGAFFAVQAAAQQMARQDPPGGSIIAMSSISALVGGAGQTHYTPTKAGVLSLMQSTACALGKYGIRCNALLPGTIRTQLNDEDLADPEKKKYMEGRIPLGRLGQPKDLAGPAVFLASDLSEYVTGAQLLVDGGLFVNLQ
ncbi:L-rhamnose-1-dehydrogenase [Friedmanniomyces endolithicus]|uniref:L-rhamnose-1-dehydrogenase n=1 Tax=Friedmanniomyces endolithicus TaxID=329885 RepID=A0A4U0TZF8_9PEZI|nr:L-rhamnose-1-dehydrogenase [Friedmanniomyces endolithicus]KAK0272991.1 L-rhamnose-1-dehydrogenase [Friedmanniomyces endolithicus]KAK0274252.1 L-rhamnose-1-dehydrogenase [Friedmanniomyces endolithicus]KAK0902637.1 L-rhamnose-1-dehydrogenase [Friedmanniomyces endolithicus]KAK0983637.1 L-rhamnose-1-dehydrogenase [Friedmanniomyces endolithicus]